MDMKRLFAVAIVIFAFGCTPEKFGDLKPPFNRKAQMVGEWKVARVVQIDEQEERQEFRTFDITNKFDFSQINLKLEADGNFSITTGTAPQFLAEFTSGTWALDSDSQPSSIVFSKGSQTSNLSLSNLNELTEGGNLNIKFVRSVKLDGEKLTPVLSYQYVFTKR
jgi:hypothetical protein